MFLDKYNPAFDDTAKADLLTILQDTITKLSNTIWQVNR